MLVVSGSPALPPPPCFCPCFRACWCCLGPCYGPLSCSVPGCGAGLFCCAACRALCCCLRRSLLCGPLLKGLRRLVPCIVACCFCVLVAATGCPLLSFGGLLGRWCSCLAAWPAALLYAVVCRGVQLPSAMSCGAVFPCGALLWCPAVFFALLVVIFFVSFPCVCGPVLRCAGAPALCCSVPLWSVLFLAPFAVVCGCVLCCFLWRSVVRWCCPVVWCGVSWCRAVPCCVLWCCAALWCRAAGLCCAFSFGVCGCCSFFL